MKDQENNGGKGREIKNGKNHSHSLKNSVYLFGDFQIFNRKGEDIAPHLYPKVRELFLLMLTSSFKPFHFINVRTMNDFLWPDQDLRGAKNNRGVTVSRLRANLEEVDGIKICCDNLQWWVELQPECYCDYERFLTIIYAKTITSQTLHEMIRILARGSFMKGHDYEWFESSRIKITDEALAKLKEQLNKHHEDAATRMLIAESILHLDHMNESAVKVKLQSLAEAGEHTAAHTAFEHFRREYKRMYGSEPKQNFSEMLNKRNE